MKLFNFKKKNKITTIDLNLISRLNDDMEYCGLSPEIQKGFLFFLGAAINIGINESHIDLRQNLKTHDLQKDTFLNIINAYSKSTGDFTNYGDLNDSFFSEMIYTFNSIIFQLSGTAPKEIDKKLIKIETNSTQLSILLKTEVNKSLQEKFANKAPNLNTYHNLLEDFFQEIGNHLNKSGYDNQRSYEVGYAYFCMQTNMDIIGTKFLLSTIYNSLTPLYKALFNYPILNFAYPEAFSSNHIFSNTLQMFYAGIKPNIIQPIHKFHQIIFYVSDSLNFRPQWDFETRNDSEKQAMIFLNAISIRETDIMSLKSQFLEYDDLMCPELKNIVIDRDEFYYTMQKGIFEKYDIRPVIDGHNLWNNLGDLIQYFCILYYETCIHAIVIEELTIEE